MAKAPKLTGVYYVQGYATESALDYAGVDAGKPFPELTNGDNLAGKHQEDFYGFWLTKPWDEYLERARTATPHLRVIFVEVSKKLPFGRKLAEPMPEWISNAIAWATWKPDGVDLGIDVLEPAKSRLRELLFSDPVPALASFRARLNSNGLFSSFDDAAEFIEAAQELPLRFKPQDTWSAHRIHWLRSVENVTVPLWGPAPA